MHTLCRSLRHVRVLCPLSLLCSQVDIPLLPDSCPRRLAAISLEPPTLLTAVSRLKTLMTAGQCYIASALTTQRTSLITVLILLLHVAIARTALTTQLPTALILLCACPSRLLSSNGRCLQSHYLANVIVQLFISWSLPSNGSTCHNKSSGVRQIYIYM
jgi:hypothetical protein